MGFFKTHSTLVLGILVLAIGAAVFGTMQSALTPVKHYAATEELIKIHEDTSVNIQPETTGAEMAVNISLGGRVQNFVSSLFKATSSSSPDSRSADFRLAAVTPNETSGTVYEDLNENQTQDGSEQGISGVTVDLYQDNNDDGFVDGGDTFLQTTATNGIGEYLFTTTLFGDFVMETSLNTYPSGFSLTTDNVEVAEFTDGGEPPEDCDCDKPSIFSVDYSGVDNVTIEIYKKENDVGDQNKILLTFTGVNDGDDVTFSGDDLGRSEGKVEANTVYRIIKDGEEIAVISVHTSCSDPLYVGLTVTDGDVTLTVLSGTDESGNSTIPAGQCDDDSGSHDHGSKDGGSKDKGSHDHDSGSKDEDSGSEDKGSKDGDSKDEGSKDNDSHDHDSHDHDSDDDSGSGGDGNNGGQTDLDNDFGAVGSTDCDGDGFTDEEEGEIDTDGDGVANSCDLDSDNDGVLDSIEGNGDTDGDGIIDYLDLDSDNDGIPDAREANSGLSSAEYSSGLGGLSGPDADGDGLIDAVDSLPAVQYGGSTSTFADPNLDNDLRVDRIDPDSDNDGILDLVEAGGVDTDGDGVVDGFIDINGDGYSDSLTISSLPVPNTDGTGSFDYRDIDSDADGIPDFREGQTTAGYTVPGTIADADSDGIVDAYDLSEGGTSIIPIDTDGDGSPDYVDTDSEDDGVIDSIEGHDSNQNGIADVTPSGSDNDGDGLDDSYDTSNSPSQWFDNNTGSSAPVQDTDGDGERDWRDTNDDDDGFLTIDEDFNTNNDWSDDFTQGGLGTPDYLFFTEAVDIEVTKSVNNTSPNVGDTISYTVIVTNNGPITGTGIVVTDLLPAGITYVSDTPSQGSYTLGTGDWSVGALLNGSSASLAIVATIDAGTGGDTITNTATRTATLQGDFDLLNDTVNAALTVQSADLAVVKTVDNGTPTEGDTVVYTITLDNNGPSHASGVEIIDLIPAGITYVSDTASLGTYNSATGVWTVGAMLNGSTEALMITATINAGSNGAVIGNIVSVTGSDQEDPDELNNTDEVTVDIRVADLSLTKTVDDATPNLTDSVVFDLVLTNNGPDSTNGVQVVDVLPTGLIFVSASATQGTYTPGTGLWDIGTVASGASETLQITATIESFAVGTTMVNSAEVTASELADPDSTPGNTSGTEDDEATQEIRVLIADLEFAKTVNNTNPNEADNVIYTLSVTNNGPDESEGVKVEDDLPVGLNFLSDNPSQGTYNDATGIWTIGTVLSGETVTLDIIASIVSGTSGDSITNFGEIIESGTADPDSTPGNTSGTEDDEDNVTITIQEADLSLTKVVDAVSANPGDIVTYTIEVFNDGPNTATNVVVLEVLPAGVTYGSDVPSQGSYNSITGIWNVGSVLSGTSETLSLAAVVDTSGAAGLTIENFTEISNVDQGDPDSTPGNTSGTEDDEASDSFIVTEADLGVEKTVNNGAPNEGDTVSYTITVTNNGPDDATGIFLTDAIPSGTTYSSDSASQGAYNSGTGIWNAGSLISGASATLILDVTVDAGTGNTIIPNNVYITGVDQGDDNATNDWDFADIDVQQADLSLTKTVNVSTPNVGDTLTYTLTIANANPDDATNVTVSDVLPAGLTFVSSTPSAGSYDDGTGIWNIGTLAGSASATLQINSTIDVGTGGTDLVNGAELMTSDQADPDSTPGNGILAEDDQDEVTISVQSADLGVTKTVDNATPDEGGIITYTINLTNNGPDVADNVVLSDVLPTGVTYTSSSASSGTYSSVTGDWNIANIAVAATEVLTITGTVDAGTGNTIITNTATVIASDQGDDNNANDSDSADIDVQQADLSLTKTIDSLQVNEGEIVTYTLSLTNSGPDDAVNVVVADSIPAGMTYNSDVASQGSYNFGTGLWTLGTVGAGQTVTLDFSTTVDVGQAGNQIVNVAEVSATTTADPDSIPGNTSGTEDDEATVSMTVLSADLAVVKTVDDPVTDEGDTVSYTITVTNNGPDDATGVQILDNVPAGLTYILDSASVGSYVSGTGIWNIGSLSNGASATLDIAVSVDAGAATSNITNTSSISAVDQTDSNPANDSSSVDVHVRGADLAITKSVSDATPSEGDTITWTVSLTNNGPDDTTGVAVSDLVPSGTTLVSSTESQGTFTFGSGVWSVGSLIDGASATMTLVATVDAGTIGTLIENTATVTGSGVVDPDDSNDTDTSGISVDGIDIAVSKTVDNSNPNIGDTVNFTILATNNGPVAVTSAILTDVIPAGLTYISDSASVGSYVSGTGIWNIGALALSATETLTLSATVNAGTAGQTITNNVALTSSSPVDPVLANNTDSAELTVQSIDLGVIKTVDDATPSVGESIAYTVSLTNAGPNDATSVIVTDLLPAGVTYVSDSASAGSYAAGTGVWSVGTVLNGGLATLTINATVDGGTEGTTINNSVSITSSDQVDLNSANNTDNTDIQINITDVSVTKVVDISNPDVGNTIQYSITVNNNGPDASTGVEITDLLPTGVTYISDSPSQGTYNAVTGVWSVGNLAVSAFAVLTVDATIDLGQGGQLVTNTATLTGVNETDSNPANNEDSVIINVKSIDLAVEKAVDNNQPNTGDTINYTITVTNNGPDTGTGIIVTDSLPTGVTYVSDLPSQGTYNAGTGVWTLGTILNGANATLNIAATVDAGTAGTAIVNTATRTFNDQGDANSANDSGSATINVASADLSVAKTVNDAAPNEGNSVTYTITVTNQGPNDATGVTITDQIPAGLTYASDSTLAGTYDSVTGVWNIGGILNGATATLNITATVNAGTGNTIITNAATVTTSDQEDPDDTNDEDSTDVDVQQADLSLTKTVDVIAPNEGDLITYTLTLSNAGPDSATGVTITDLLTSELTFSSDIPSQGTYSDTSGVWNVGTITSGGSATLDIAAIVNNGTTGQTILNAAEVVGSDTADPDSTPGNTSGTEDDEATVSVSVLQSDLSLTKTVDNAAPNVSDNITYTITVANAGPDTAGSVTVQDLLPAGLTYVSNTASQGTYDENTGLWTVGAMTSGAASTLNITATVDAGTGNTAIVNSAEVETSGSVDPDSTPGNTSGTEDDEDSVTINVTSADLNVVKTVDDATPNEGDSVTYTITVTNEGPDNATGVTITDQIPAGLTYTSSSTSTGVYDSGSGVLTIGSILSGDSVTIDINATVNSGTGDTIITNTASVTTSDQEDPDDTDDEDSADVDVQQADLSLTKVVDDDLPSTGDSVTYTLTVTNGGPDLAENVVILDSLPAGVTYVSDTASIGSYNFGTGLWTLGSVAASTVETLEVTVSVDAGQEGNAILNSAQVNATDTADPDSTPGNTSGTEDDEDGAMITIIDAELALTKTVDNEAPNEGDSVTWTIGLTNNGPDAATGVEVTDLLPTGVTYTSDSVSQGTYNDGTGAWSVGSLASGGVATLTLSSTVDAGTAASTIENTGTITAVDQTDSNPANNTSSASITVKGADLAVTKTVSNGTPVEGDSVTWIINITNNGPDATTGVTLQDTLPAGVTYTSDSATQGTYSSGTGAWSVGSLASGGSATLTIVSTVNVGTTGSLITNTATITGNNLVDNNPANDSAEASISVAGTDLSVTKTVDNSNPNINDSIIYTITVTNDGPDAVTASEITDTLPAGLTYSSSGASQGTYSEITGVWNIGGMAVGASATLQVVATINSDQAGQTISNTGTLTSSTPSDPTPANNTATTELTVQSIDLGVSVVVDDATPNVAQSIEYTFTTVNNGPSNATNVVATDLLPAGVTYVSSIPGQGTYNDTTGVWTIGSILSGGSTSIVITATVDGGTEGTTIQNTVTTTSSDQVDVNGANNSNSVNITISVTDISVAKTVSDSSPAAGDTVLYSMTINNNGPDAATGITINDLLPAGVTYASNSATNGTYNNLTGIWTLGDLAVSAFAVLTVEATVDAGQGGATVGNTVSLASVDQTDSNPSNNTDSADFTVNSVDVGLAKTVDNATPIEGETIVYSVTASNNGPDTATAIVVTDALPAGATFISVVASQGTFISGTGVWNVGNIGNGGAATLDITMTVNASTAATVLNNAVTVNSVAEGDTDESNNTASVNVTVQSPPIAVDESVVTDEDVSVDIDVPNNDTDVDNDINLASITITLPPTNGTVSVNPTTGVATYIPAADFFGTDNFTYQICDLQGQCDTAIVEITVGTLPDPPIATNDSGVTLQATAISIDVPTNDTDVDNDIVITTVTQISSPLHGTVSVDPVTGVMTYTPEASYVGTDTFDYQICDSTGLCDTATVVITITTPVASAVIPIIPLGNLNLPVCTATTQVAVDLTSTNATFVIVGVDPFFTASSWTTFNNTETRTITLPAGDGNKQVYAQFRSATGNLSSVVIGSVLLDEENGCLGEPIEPKPPVALNDSVSTDINTPVTLNVPGNDTDPDDDIDFSTVEILVTTVNGTATVNPISGIVTYTPNLDYYGTDTFTYMICDETGLCDTAGGFITIFAPPGEECTLTCNDLTYDLYIVNPDGTERHMNTLYARTNTIGFKKTRVSFEDSGQDFDYNDVIIDIDAIDCNGVRFSYYGGSATWSHEVRAKIFYQGVEKNDITLWPDSQRARGGTVSVNAVIESNTCGPNDVVIVIIPEQKNVCEVSCADVAYDLFIVNPDGTERHTGTQFVQATPIGPLKTRFAFEDKGDDFDYNDVVLEVDALDCENVTINAIAGDAAWHHEIWMGVDYRGTIGRDLLWPDSQAALQQEVKYTFLDSAELVCDIDDLRIVTPISTEEIGEGVLLDEQEDLGPQSLIGSFVNEEFPTPGVFITGLENTVEDFFSGGLLTFLTGVLSGDSRNVISYEAGSKRITVDPEFDESPAFGDAFQIVSQDIEVTIPRIDLILPEDLIDIDGIEDLYEILKTTNTELDVVDNETNATVVSDVSDIQSYADSLVGESNRLKGVLQRLALTEQNNLVFNEFFVEEEGDITDPVDILNKVADLRAMSAATRRVLETKGTTPVVESYMTFGSLKINFLVMNPLRTNQVVGVRSFLPQEVRAEDFMEFENVEVTYEEASGRYVGTSEAVIGPHEVFVYSVSVADVWQVPDDEMKMLTAEIDALEKVLIDSAFEPQAMVGINEVRNALTVVKDSQVAGFESPQRHIIVYRENQLRLAAIRTKLDQLQDLAQKAQTLQSREQTIRILVPIIGIVISLAVIGGIGIGVYSYARGSSRRRKRKK